MGDRSSSLKFIVLNSCPQWPTPCFYTLTSSKIVPERHMGSECFHHVWQLLLCSWMIAKAVCQPLLLIFPAVFRKNPRCPGYNSRMLNLGLGRHRPWGSSDDAQEKPRLRTTDSFQIHTGKNPRSYHGPQRPYTTNLVALPLSPAHCTLDMGTSWLFLDLRALFPSQAPAIIRILQNVLSLSCSLSPCRSLLRCYHFREALLGYSF